MKYQKLLSSLGFITVFSLVFNILVVEGATSRVPAEVIPSGVSVLIPFRAVEVAPHVFDLGTTLDEESGKVVQGYAIVHRTNKARGGSGGPAKSTACYGFLAKGAKWKSVEPWVLNAQNPDGMTEGSVFSLLSNSISKWEDAADGVVGNATTKNILGDGSLTASTLVADNVATDGVNEIYFDELEEGTIGVTIVWGIFGGPTFSRELVEWDQVYNTLYGWSDTGAGDKMDFENIATHELGHSVGLGDLYTASCVNETMYGYSSEGDISKRTLESGDISGVTTLYK